VNRRPRRARTSQTPLARTPLNAHPAPTNCIDERFRNSLPAHDCQTARYAALAGLENGELLAAAEKAKFEIFLTVDQGIEYQQNLTNRKIAIIILHARSNRLKDLLPLVPACLTHIETIQPRQNRQHRRLIIIFSLPTAIRIVDMLRRMSRIIGLSCEAFSDELMPGVYQPVTPPPPHYFRK